MIEERNLWPLVEARAAATPGELFAIDEEDRALDFDGYRRAVERCATALAGLGIGVGSRVSWQLPTTLESLVLVAALARLGAVQNPILPFLREREVGFIARQLEPELLIVPGVWRGFDHETMARALDGPRVLNVSELPGLELTAPAAAGPSAPAPEPRDWRFTFYSSGTMADPKGARHSDATLAASAVAMTRRFDLRPDDRVALVFPITHVGGVGWLMASLMAGCALIVVPVFDPKTTPALLARHDVTQATAGTVFHQAYLAAQRTHSEAPLFPKVRCFPGGGAPKPPQLHADLKREMGGVGIVSGYGLTEFPIAALGDVRDPDEKLAHTEGRATDGVEIRITGEDGKLRAAFEEGEVYLRGPQQMLGYVDASLESDAMSADGFLRSGDLGHVDAEGHLVITGRAKDVIVRKGENISAKQVEDLLFGHPAIADVALVGLPDEASGERACAVVVTAPGVAAPGLADLGTFLRGQGLAAQKLPEQLELVDELPRNASGKVLKRDLRVRFS